MWVQLKHWLVPPFFVGNSEQINRVRLLNTLLIAYCIFILILFLAGQLGGKLSLVVSGLEILLIACGLALLFWIRRGGVKLAGIALIALILIGATTVSALLGTIRTPSLSFYILAVITAGLLFHLRGTILTVVLSSLFVLGLVLTENAHLLPPADYTVNVTQWLTASSIFCLVGILIYYLDESGLQALSQAVSSLEERKKVEAQLRESEERYRHIFEYATEGIFQSGSAGRFIRVNPAMARMYGYASPEDMVASITDISRQIYADPAKRIAFQTGLRTAGIITGFEAENLRKDGTSFWITCNARAVYNSEGEFLFYEGTVQDISDRKRSEEQLRYLISHDALTGIFNRTFFEEELARLDGGREYPVSIIIIDVDNMKLTNDSLGHAAGDALLKHTALILKSAFRTEEVLARIGGDEFAVLLPFTDANTAEQIERRVREKLEEFNVCHPDISVQVSIGVATTGPHNLSEAFTNADQRMYAEKFARREMKRAMASSV